MYSSKSILTSVLFAATLISLIVLAWHSSPTATAQSPASSRRLAVVGGIAVGGRLTDIAVTQRADSQIADRAYVVNRQTTRLNVINTQNNTVVGQATVNQPFGVAVDDVRNRIYGTNQFSDTVDVVDQTNTITRRVAVGSSPYRLAVNTSTNTIYVTHFSEFFAVTNSKLRAINGETFAVTEIPVTGSRYVAVNEALNHVYVTEEGANRVNVVSGSSNTVLTSIQVSEAGNADQALVGLALNATTGRLYVLRKDGRLAIINVDNNEVITTLEGDPFLEGEAAKSVAVDEQLNLVYVAQNRMVVYDGATNQRIHTTSFGQINAVAVNKRTSRVYTAGEFGDVAVLFPQLVQIPPSATTPRAWFRADDIKDVSDGGAVQSWVESANGGTPARQADVIRAPKLILDAINGKPAVRFDGTDDQLQFPLLINSNFTVVAVFRSAGGTDNGSQWHNASGIVDAEVAQVNNDFGLSFSTDGRVLAGTGNPDVTAASAPGFNNQQAHVAVFRRTRTTGAIELFVDGNLVDTKTGGTQFLTAAGRIVLGSLQTNINYFPGDIAEVLVYNVALSDAERQQVQTYATDKYAITVAPESRADLTLDLQGTGEPARTGGDAILTLRINNNGPDHATGLRVRFEPLPEGVELKGDTFSACVQAADRSVVCNFNPATRLTTEQSFVTRIAFNFPRRVTQAETITLRAAVSSGEVDPNANNNSDAQDIQLTPPLACVEPDYRLVHWYRGEANTNDTIGRRHGTAEGGLISTPGKVGQGFRFNGTDAAITTASTAVLNNLPLTIEAWVKPELRDDGTDFPVNVVSNDRRNFGGHGFGLNVFPGGSQLKIAYQDGTRVVPNVSFEADTWYHIVVQYRFSVTMNPLNQPVLEGRVRTLVNAVEVDDIRFVQGASDGENLIRIGKHNDDAGFGTRRFFKGVIDEVSIYTHFLPLGDIGDIVRADDAGKCSPAQAPPNDHIQNARILNRDINNPSETEDRTGRVVGTNQGATRQVGDFLPNVVNKPDEPLHAGRSGGKSVWYQWRAPYTGSVTFNTKDSNFDTLLAVYGQARREAGGQTFTQFVEVASNDNFEFTNDRKIQSRVRFRAIRNVTYFIAVDGDRGAIGNIDLDWNLGRKEDPKPVTSRLTGIKDLAGNQRLIIPVGRETPLTITLTGEGFRSGAQAFVIGEEDASGEQGLVTVFRGDSTQLEVEIPARYFREAGDLLIRVRHGNELAANTAVIQVTPINFNQVAPGQTANVSNAGDVQIRPPARYTLSGVNNTPQPVTIAVQISPLERIGATLGNIFNATLGGFINAFDQALRGLKPAEALPPGSQVLGNALVQLAVNPRAALSDLKLVLAPTAPLIGADGATLIGADGGTLVGNNGNTLRNRAAIVAAGGGNLIGADGGTLLSPDGSTLTGRIGNVTLLRKLAGALNPKQETGDATLYRTGWYVYRDAQGGNGSLRTQTDDEGNVTLEATIDINSQTNVTPADLNSTKFGIVLNPSYLTFAQDAYTVAEGAGSVTITVRRTNNTESAAVVTYQTTSLAAPAFSAPAGTANRDDYTPATGGLFFAPGETEKTFTILLTGDRLPEGTESFNVLLNNAYGAAVDGTGSVRVNITDTLKGRISRRPRRR